MLSPLRRVFKYIQLVATQLKWASDYLLQQSFSSCRLDLRGIVIGEPGIRRYHSSQESAERAECSICLCKLEEGDEVRELRCDHLFHRVCLDRWLGQGRITCPLCRNYLTLPSLASKINQEVVLFRFCSAESRERELWWIR